MITIIIPLRLSKIPLYDEIERLDRIIGSIPDKEFSILIVDYGTCEDRIQELQDLSAQFPSIKILHTGDPTEPFSIGAARDIGVQYAKTAVIMFHDLDFLCETESYRDIAAEVSLREFDKKGYDYLCIPTIFLTDAGTEDYLSKHNKNSRRDADRNIHNQALRNLKNENIEHYALGSSALIINRYFYLLSGGHNRCFVGHGAEDFEFYNRLSDLAMRAGRPPKYTKNISFNIGRWEGFRSYFSLYGMEMWMRGVILVHLNHPRRELVDKTYKKSSHNFQLLKNRLEEFRKKRQHLPPLNDPYVSFKTLLLVDPKSIPAGSLRGVLPALGRYEMMPEGVFETPQLLIQYIEEEGIDHILFLNPYGNTHRLSLYNAVRDTGIKCYAFDRGALPDSWFFDDSGFLGNSTNYDPEKWNHPLDPEIRSRIKEWIGEFVKTGTTLEPNEPRRSGDYWRQELGIGKRKIIFIALQRPSDTATRYFAGPAGTYPMFLEWISELAKHLDRRRYVLVIKKHPLERERPDFGSVRYVPDSANIHDLIEVSDKVVILNSGTGVLAIAMNKPVIVCGNAYYAKGGLAYQANTGEELIELVHSELKTNPELGERFIHYLREKFYSFGRSHYVEKKQLDDSVFKLCSRIDFSTIRGFTEQPIELGSVPNWIPPASFLFRGVSTTKIQKPHTIKGTLPLPVTEEVRYIDAYNRGCTAFHRSDYEVALKDYTEALALQPNNANLRRVLAEALLKQGHHKKATIHLMKAHELLPHNKAIKRRLNHVKHPLIGRLSKTKPFPVPAGS